LKTVEVQHKGSVDASTGDGRDVGSSKGEPSVRDKATNPARDGDREILRWLAPPPKVERVYTDHPGPSSSTVVEDSEWGLGVESRPSEPVEEALLAKLSNFHKLKNEQGIHFNQSLAKNRSFRNPHIFDKLVQWVGVEETASGYGEMTKMKGKGKADDVWMSSQEARSDLRVQGGREVIGEW
jgi:hypothetical protein